MGTWELIRLLKSLKRDSALPLLMCDGRGIPPGADRPFERTPVRLLPKAETMQIENTNASNGISIAPPVICPEGVRRLNVLRLFRKIAFYAQISYFRQFTTRLTEAGCPRLCSSHDAEQDILYVRFQEKHSEFELEILSGIESLFPCLHDGSVVFKFSRLFFIARKKQRC